MSTLIDLSALPAPDALAPLDYEALLAARKAALLALLPPEQQADMAKTLTYESEPLVKLLEESAYRELLIHAMVNDAWRATTLAYAEGNDLAHRAANVGVSRLLLTPADDSSTPPTPAVYESDARLRYRAQLAPEALSVAGPDDAYLFHTMAANPRVADVYIHSPAPVEVQVVVLSHEHDGTPDADLLAQVSRYLRDIQRRPLTDRVSVLPARIIHATLDAELIIGSGPDASQIVAEAYAAFYAALAAGDTQLRKSRLGQMVDLSLVHAALRRPGVVRVVTDFTDILCQPDQAVVFDRVTLTHQVL